MSIFFCKTKYYTTNASKSKVLDFDGTHIKISIKECECLQANMALSLGLYSFNTGKGFESWQMRSLQNSHLLTVKNIISNFFFREIGQIYMDLIKIAKTVNCWFIVTIFTFKVVHFYLYIYMFYKESEVLPKYNYLKIENSQLVLLLSWMTLLLLFKKLYPCFFFDEKKALIVKKELTL